MKQRVCCLTYYLK